MPRIIVIANQKGGVSKTTTVANLGIALSKLGHQVAMVDLDPQGALTVSFGFDPYHIKPSTYDILLANDFPLDGILRDLSPEASLAPANTELIAAEYRLLKEPDRTFRLKNAIARSNRGIDYILIDTPPSLGLLTINALVSANELLIPVATDYLAMRGVRSLMESVWFIRERINPDLRLLGLVPTLYRKDSPHANAVISEMQKVFKHKVMRTFIPQDEAASAAPAARKSVLDYQPNSRVAAAYMQLAKEIDHGR
ncbi:MAG TPA: ParA family protein [Anaerolineales bacterium]|jgi:chromosome partitioning protein|nr:ParA family protein [Anaerolineales bacterium]